MSGHVTVVAGGAGFLGSHICDELIERGDHVVCVDDFSTGSVLNIAHLIGHERFQLVDHDVVERGLEDRVHDLLEGAPVTRVLNFASPASPPEYLRRPIDTLEAGSIGTQHLLDLADRYGARFFLASTSEVYGDPLEHPQKESYWGNVNPVGERSVYDEAKRFSEALTMAYHRAYGLDVRIARIFNTYGPRMQADDGRVVTNFVNQALRGEAITIYGDGTQTRSFCYVDDEVRGLLAVLDGPLIGPVNVGNPCEFTMRKLADLVLNLTGSASAVVHRPLPSDDPKLRRPDISIARDVLGWEPSISLAEGLTRTVAWFRDGAYARHSAHAV
jgi:nucleoside-diphosphate-sugar epimerase